MFELFVAKTQFIYFWFIGYSEYFFVPQLLNIVIVFVVFEYQWHETQEDDFIKKNKSLLSKLDKKTFEGFKYAFAFIPFISLYLYCRCLYQKFDTVKFIKDYGVKREL